MPGHCRRHGHARILVVDDHRTYRLLMGALLDRLAVAHQSCADGQQALQLLKRESFDLIITDCRMPVMDGYALTRALRRHEQQAGGRRIPVLAFTACLGPDEVRRCLDAGMDGWLTKPIGIEALGEVLRHWLQAAQLPADKAPEEVYALPTTTGFPTRAGLVATFGSWDLVQLMVASLIREAYEDLALLELARAQQDADVAIQRLHRLVGSVAFLGAIGLEQKAAQLIEQVKVAGVALSAAALDSFQQDIEAYLHYLAAL